MARRVRGRRATVTAIVTVLVAVALPACSSGGGSGPDEAADAYLRAWNRQDYRALAKQARRPPPDLEETGRALLAAVKAGTVETRTDGEIREDGDRAEVDVVNTYTSEPFGAWETRGVLALTKRDDVWKVRWSPALLTTELTPQRSWRMRVSWPERAPILGAGGVPLTIEGAMVRVGIQGSRITDEAALVGALQVAGISGAAVENALATARQNPDWFVPVTEMTAARYAQVRDGIYPVPGTVFQNFGERVTLTDGLASHVVGRTGPITAEILEELGSPYGPNDRVGRAGIEASYERELAGTPGATVEIMGESGVAVATLAEWAPTPGTPVPTSIDPGVQQAAEAALAGVDREATIVAVRASTGEILASAVVPSSQGYNIGLRGQYPPGSTFKIITTAALLENGLAPGTPLDCPSTVTVAGQSFRNYEGESGGTLSLADALATSCNNAFVNATREVPYDVLPAAAAKFGVGKDPQIGVAAHGGSVPTPTGPSEQAATSIGQAKVTVSPLTMASVAATVAAGAWHAPRLVAGAPNDSVAPVPLDPGITSALQQMMSAVVARGTARGAGLPAGSAGKTGTAEFGSASPPETHAWFVGYRGDIAFAVLVPEGGVGGEVAAPIAARFLNSLP